jgi:hypothetical protein
MLPSDGPPARNTHSTQLTCCNPVHEPQSTPPTEESLTSAQDSAIAHSESSVPVEESPLTSIAEAPDDGIRQSEGDTPPINRHPSKHSTICEAPEELDISLQE